MNNNNEKGSIKYLTAICLVATLGGLLFGYDTAVISGAIGSLQTHFSLTPSMVGWAASCALAGCFVGVAFAGEINDRLGRRLTLIIAAILFLISAIGTALPRNLTEFIIFRFIGGLGVGAASMTSPMYIAEISPARLRGRMVSINQLAIVTGMMVVYFVNYYISGLGDEAWNTTIGWRWMFGSESLPAISLLIMLLFVPESPRWLTKQGRESDARHILTRIDGTQHAEREMSEIKLALQQESGSLSTLFQSGMRIMLVIGIILAVLQQITGINVILYYGPEIFKQAGVATNVALLWTISLGACMMIFTLIAISTVDKVGRKPLMIIGSIGMCICLIASGLAFFMQTTGAWALLFILGYIACFSLSVGPVTWVILSEIFPTKIRGRAMAIATFCLWVANFIVSQTFPMMDKNEYLIAKFHHAFPFWVYAAFCVVLVLFVWKIVPETKGKTLEEIEKNWQRHRND